MLFANLRTEFAGLLDPRKMGALDGRSSDLLQEVWANDLADETSTPPPVPASQEPAASVESCVDLYRRCVETFSRLEGTYFGDDIILVSHQDVLSVYTAALMGTELSRHHLDWPYELGQGRLIDLTKAPGAGDNYSPQDFRGTYAQSTERS